MWDCDAAVFFKAVCDQHRLHDTIAVPWANNHPGPRRFYRLNAAYNQQTEQQVRILESAHPEGILSHLNKIRRVGIRLSDTEAYVYGAIYTAMLGLILFNLWFAATNMEITVGRIFSIISYSWEFIDSALVLPVTLQSWSRLSEIMQRINRANDPA